MKRAIISNVVGNVISFIFSLIAVPIQIRLLGAEAYGLIGFVASLQIILVVFDFGLSSSVVREIAASSDDDLSAKIVQTSATVYWLVATIIGCCIFAGADWIATHWLHGRTFTPEYLATSVRIIAVYMILTWPVGHYANVLFAFKRLDLVNGLRVVVSFVTQAGGILVILITRDLTAFLTWLTFGSLVSVIVHMAFVKRIFAAVSLMPGISRRAVQRLWRTSFDMNVVSTTATIYTQLDKFLISNLLPLSLLGYYNIAYRLMVGATLIPASVGATTLPSFTESYTREQHDTLVNNYNRVAQLIIFIMSGFTFAFVFWGQDVIRVWTSTETAASTYQTLGILSIGALLNTVTVVAYYLLLASGHSRQLSIIYSIGVLPYVICLYWLIVNLQIIGAAFALILYSVYLIFTLLVYASRQITHEGVIRWLNRNFTVFVLAGAGIFGAGRWIVEATTPSSVFIVWGMGLIAGTAYGLVGFYLLDTASRATILSILTKTFRSLLKRGN